MTIVVPWRRARALAPLLVLLPVLTVLDRPVMIDDTLFLKAAAQILRDPARPYDFTVNWYGWSELFWEVFKNPPGLSYWLAAAQALGVTGEVGLHLVLLPFAIAAVLGGLRLGRRFVGTAEWTTAAWAASPAFVVAAASLMADVPALALSLWGLALWIEGVDRKDSRRRRLGALLAGLAVILKYTSVLAVAVLAAYVLVGRARGRRRGLGDLWVASLPSFAWGLLTLGTTGRVHMMDALVVGGGGFDPNPGWFGHRAIAILTFVAGTGIATVVLAALAARGRTALVHAGSAVAIGVGAAVLTPWIWPVRALRPGSVAFVGLLAAAGAFVLLRAFADAWLDRDSRFLAVWAALHVVYLWLWSWTIAGRFVLPLLVPVTFLLARALARERPGRAPAVFATAAALALAAAFLLVRADSFAGEVYRRAVPALAAQARQEGRRAWFVGSWGFQHYAEAARLERIDTNRVTARGGDLIFQPYYAANAELPPAVVGRLRQVGDVRAPAPLLDLHTMNLNVGAGYHSSAFGPVPYFRAHVPAEGIKVWLVGGS
ncbi:MAG: glycosyltransferase family 39 protein [Candidatus Rokubacteria bacterium]|nr:glycosyltransferase family 39 protein [Candidatus Rokubacteria bacterium]